MSKTLTERLAEVQVNLKAPKGQMNKFGGYAYRSCEDILEAVKPLLDGLVLTLSDEILVMPEGNRVYVTATASITDGTDTISVKASAREAETKKGMDEAQITGSASSYARKYALNGLFLIDDTKDDDATNDHGKGQKKDSPLKKKEESKEDRKSSNRTTRSKDSKKEEEKVTEEESTKEEKTTGSRRGNYRRSGRK